jgi:hypothetical protein
MDPDEAHDYADQGPMPNRDKYIIPLASHSITVVLHKPEFILSAMDNWAKSKALSFKIKTDFYLQGGCLMW